MLLAISTNWNSRSHQSGETLVEECLEAGVDRIELGYALTHRQAEDVLRLHRQGQIKITSVHAYCPVPMGASSGHPELFSVCDRFGALRKRAVRELLRTAEFAVSAGAGTVVLHAGRVRAGRIVSSLTRLAGEDRMEDARYRKKHSRLLDLRDRRISPVMKRLRAALHEILPAFEKLGVVLALENLPTWDAVPNEAEMLTLLDEFNSPALAYWHDLGHAQIRENMGFIHHKSVLKLLMDRTAGWHVHDVRFPTFDHIMPPGGEICFEDFRDMIVGSGIPTVIEPAPGTHFDEVKRAVEFIRSVWT